jgi:hypothetical protein
MTNEQKAQTWYEEWEYFVKNPDNAISFAAFCLDNRDGEIKHEQGQLDAIINYTSSPERMVVTDFVVELTGMDITDIVREYKKWQNK